jgi:hypothetical protein
MPESAWKMPCIRRLVGLGSLLVRFCFPRHLEHELDLSTLIAHGLMAPNKVILCKFFAQGSYRNRGSYNFIHKGNSPQAPADSRAKIPCKFLPRPGGCQNGSCLYLHAIKMSDLSPNDPSTHFAPPPQNPQSEQHKDEEGISRYEPGGFHPVRFHEIYDNQYMVIGKLGWGRYSTVWLVQDIYITLVSLLLPPQPVPNTILATKKSTQ